MRTAVFLLRVILPLSFAVALLDRFGILARIGALVGPVMQVWRLPGEAAVALVSGWLTGIYGAVAAMSVLTLDPGQVTVFAVLTLTAHNLPVECAVQHRTGTSWATMLATRVIAAGALGWLVALAVADPIGGAASSGGAAGVLGAAGDAGAANAARAAGVAGAAAAATVPFSRFLFDWALGAARLAAKVGIILLALMWFTEWMRRRDLYHRLAGPLRPVLRVLGLSDSVAFLWITGIVVGLAYGSGLLMDEAREPGRYRSRDLRDLNVSIGVTHSILEDTALLAAVGASVFWITIPRVAAAAVAVRVVRLADAFDRRVRKRRAVPGAPA